MSGEWAVDQWIGWLRRNRTDSVPSWQGLNDAANVISDEIARLRGLEKAHNALCERITALGDLVSANATGAFAVKAAWDILMDDQK